MCGVFGYVGRRDSVSLIMDGLHALEYRGYDSSGIAVIDNNGLKIRRAGGKLINLENLLEADPIAGLCGLGHTRWATHGRPNIENAHPHRDCRNRIAVVHNGIIENYIEIKQKLIEEGHTFQSETDTEVIAHLLEKNFQGSLEDAVFKTVPFLRGLYSFVCISLDDRGKIVAVRVENPLIVGWIRGEGYVTSDIPAMLPYTRSMVHMGQNEVAVITEAGIKLFDFNRKEIEPDYKTVDWDVTMAVKGSYKHFMLKEIHEQSTAIEDTIFGRYTLTGGEAQLDDMGLLPEVWKSFKQVRILACGTSFHAALAGKYMIETIAQIPVEVEYASEYRYRNPVIIPDTLFIAITQSGETLDTVAAQRLVHTAGGTILVITNVMGSMASRIGNAVLYTRAGPEIGVASTKAFTTQLACLYLIALKYAEIRQTMNAVKIHNMLTDLVDLPKKVKEVLENNKLIQEISKVCYQKRSALFLGRGIHYPIALEGALKLKELSYIHAEGYPAGEMKHGPNALIDENLPVIFLAACDPSSNDSYQRYTKVLSNMEEVKARDGIIIAIGIESDQNLADKSNYVISIPTTNEFLLSILEVIVLQLLAYHTALRRGCDIDQPRNLAKSVTVE